jgi:two-component system response regulator
MDKLEILVVEDNDNDVELLTVTLKYINLQNNVSRVKDGQEALDYLFCQNKYSGRNPCKSPGLILLDLRLPKLDGLEVLRTIKSDNRTKDIPVIVMTSSDYPLDAKESYQYGTSWYIVKPVTLESFVTAISGIGFKWTIFNKE